MRVLIADDDRATRYLLERAVRGWGYDAHVVADGREALAVLRATDRPMLAVLDWEMPGLDGPEVCRRVRELHDSSYRYIVMLTVRDGQEDLVAGFEAGVDDYLRKPVDVNELRLRLQAGRRLLDLQARLLQTQEELRYQAAHDGLTGLLTHVRMLEALEREAERARREGSWLTVLMADLDRFKVINDTFGHQAGDAVLQETARRVREAVRGYDLVGRMGGEEFLVILPGVASEAAERIAERVRESIGAMRLAAVDGPIRATVSIGVASVRGGDEADARELLRRADEALYRAKENGRDRVELAETRTEAA